MKLTCFQQNTFYLTKHKFPYFILNIKTYFEINQFKSVVNCLTSNWYKLAYNTSMYSEQEFVLFCENAFYKFK